jgi:hypothetical protein
MTGIRRNLEVNALETLKMFPVLNTLFSQTDLSL